MLGRSTHAIRLDAANEGRRHLARKQRVFGIILEIATAERVAMDVHAWCKKHIDTVFQHFVAHCLGCVFDEL